MSESISISFPKRHRPLYLSIKQTYRTAKKKAKGKKLRLADHARQLLQKGFDCTCARPYAHKPRSLRKAKIVVV